MPVSLLSYRELAVAWQPRKSRRARPQQPAKLFLSPAQSTVVPLILTLAGLSSAMFFALNLKTPVTIKLVGSNSVSAAPAVSLPEAAAPITMTRSEPLRLRVPKIALDTSLISVGLNPAGNMVMPEVFDAAAWYKEGPTPGELGPAVVVGHVDSPKDIAIFWRVRELVPGDQVLVDRQDGTTATFKVTAIEQVAQEAFPTQAVYGDIDHAGIRLITCSGTFNPTTQHYTHNTIVYGSLM